MIIKRLIPLVMLIFIVTGCAAYPGLLADKNHAALTVQRRAFMPLIDIHIESIDGSYLGWTSKKGGTKQIVPGKHTLKINRLGDSQDSKTITFNAHAGNIYEIRFSATDNDGTITWEPYIFNK